MQNLPFQERLRRIRMQHEALINQPNEIDDTWYNGVYARYQRPVLTADHAPLEWRFDLNPETNPLLLQRLGVNSVFNAGAIEHDGKILMMCRVEGDDRKSFFAVAESDNGIDGFRFWDYPVLMPETDNPDTNVYDMRLVKHEDGNLYGLFCTERKDPDAPANDTSSAVAQCGIARTKDFQNWERLPDLKSSSPQQRNVVLHPEFVNGKYALYTRPQDGFIDTGKGGGIGYGLSDSMENAEVKEEIIIEPRIYHTVKEVKNGLGPAPIKTDKGWLQLAHGTRNTASGLRYVLYMFMTDLNDPSKVIASPGGHFIAARGEERVGDLCNVAFANGWVARDNGEVLIYYASCDTTMWVATSTVDRLVDYCLNTPEDALRTHECVKQRHALIDRNKAYSG